MIKGLLFVGLALIPLVLRLDVFPILPRDIDAFRLTKEFLSLLFAGAIGFVALYRGKIKPVKNYWILILLILMSVSRFVGPSYKLEILNTNIGAFWIYQPLSYALIYFLMYVGISGQDWNIRLISKIIGWVGFIVSFYLILQYFDLDQFQNVYQVQQILASTSPKLSSTIFHFNYSGSFIALCLPFVIYNKGWFRLAVMVTAVILTKGQMSIGMAGIVLAGYVFYKSPRELKLILSALAGTMIAGIWKYFDLIFPHIQSSGRFEVWQKLIEKTLANCPITGYTLGAYRYVFVNAEGTPLLQAHNEILEFFFGMGIPVTCIFIAGIGWFFVKSLRYLKDEETFLLVLSFSSIFAGSMGLFLWQADPHRFYSVAILGLITSQIRKGEQLCLTKK